MSGKKQILEALEAIGRSTISNLIDVEQGGTVRARWQACKRGVPVCGCPTKHTLKNFAGLPGVQEWIVSTHMEDLSAPAGTLWEQLSGAAKDKLTTKLCPTHPSFMPGLRDRLLDAGCVELTDHPCICPVCFVTVGDQQKEAARQEEEKRAKEKQRQGLADKRAAEAEEAARRRMKAAADKEAAEDAKKRAREQKEEEKQRRQRAKGSSSGGQLGRAATQNIFHAPHAPQDGASFALPPEGGSSQRKTPSQQQLDLIKLTMESAATLAGAIKGHPPSGASPRDTLAWLQPGAELSARAEEITRQKNKFDRKPPPCTCAMPMGCYQGWSVETLKQFIVDNSNGDGIHSAALASLAQSVCQRLQAMVVLATATAEFELRMSRIPFRPSGPMSGMDPGVSSKGAGQAQPPPTANLASPIIQTMLGRGMGSIPRINPAQHFQPLTNAFSNASWNFKAPSAPASLRAAPRPPGGLLPAAAPTPSFSVPTPSAFASHAFGSRSGPATPSTGTTASTHPQNTPAPVCRLFQQTPAGPSPAGLPACIVCEQVFQPQELRRSSLCSKCQAVLHDSCVEEICQYSAQEKGEDSWTCPRCLGAPFFHETSMDVRPTSRHSIGGSSIPTPVFGSTAPLGGPPPPPLCVLSDDDESDHGGEAGRDGGSEGDFEEAVGQVWAWP